METLKNILYPLQPPSRVRTRPMQVLAVGPARSGTDSLRTALVQLGYDHTYHGYDVAMNPADDKVWYQLCRKKWRNYPTDQLHSTSNNRITASDFDQVIGHCMAITDHAAAAFAPELIAAYPDAKVILNVRGNFHAWHTSVMNTVVALQRDWRFWLRSWFCTELFWVQESFLRGTWQNFYWGDFERNSIQVLTEHCAMVKRILPPERLLEWDVEDGWEPLCKFLGKDIPNTPFPKGNNTTNYAQRIEEYYRANIAKADRNMYFCLVVISLAVSFFNVLR